MKSEHACWEVEGQVYERVDRALVESEKWRLGNVAKGCRERRLRRRILTTLSAAWAWLAVRGQATVLRLRGVPDGDQDQSRGAVVDRSPLRTAIEVSGDGSSMPLHG
jgi:hypothetical protein